MERQISLILANSRPAGIIDAGVEARPDRASPARGRPRYGAFGLIASAALAVVATLLWVSPSAGAPSRQGAGAQVTQVRVPAAPSVAADGAPDQAVTTR
jgi:hypothetical protein